MKNGICEAYCEQRRFLKLSEKKARCKNSILHVVYHILKQKYFRTI